MRRRGGVGRAERGSEPGQSTVEVALMLPVVLVLLLAVLQVGLVARDVVLVAHAAREAARVAAVDGSVEAARRAAVQSSGLRGDRVRVMVTGRGGPGSRVQVEVAYRSPTTVPLVGELVGDHVIEAAATMRVESE